MTMQTNDYKIHRKARFKKNDCNRRLKIGHNYNRTYTNGSNSGIK